MTIAELSGQDAEAVFISRKTVDRLRTRKGQGDLQYG